MADSIQFQRGSRTGLPLLPDGVPGWCRDTGELFIGSPAGNKKVGGDIQERLTAQTEVLTALQEAVRLQGEALTALTQRVSVLEQTEG